MRHLLRFLAPVLAVAAAGCANSGPPQGITPYQPSPGMAAVLQERSNMRAVEPASVTVARAREVPNLIAAMQAMPNVRGLPADSPEVPVVRLLASPGADVALPARIYQPQNPTNGPMLIYFTADTWVTGGLDDYDESLRQLASRTGWVVVGIGLRHAPDATFPGIHDDAFVAYQWARTHAKEWGADPTRIALGGESAGANLALSTALLARDRRVPMPNYLLLITPVAGTGLSGTSMSESGRSRPLSRRTVSWAQQQYVTSSRQLLDPRLDLVSRPDLAGTPPTTIVLAEIDPLRSGGEELAARLQAAGVRTNVRMFPGTTHDFFGLGERVVEAAAAEDYAAANLKTALNPPPPPPPVRPHRPARRRIVRREHWLPK